MLKLRIKNLNVEDILTSGSCFRSIIEEDKSITNILSDRVINIKQDNDILYIESSNYDNLENIINDYFDLKRDYDKINNEIILNNSELKDLVESCKCYRILNQNSFEVSIRYIKSQNNNVKRIANSINEISILYGNKVIFNNKEYYLFPTYEQLKDITDEDLKKIKVGFRDKYIRNYLDNYNDLMNINNISTTDALKELMNIKGIGLKVASCILLFGYRRLDVFPIDTWVRKYISQNYNIKNTQKEIEKFAKSKFKEYSGLVIQYMFHGQRNLNK